MLTFALYMRTAEFRPDGIGAQLSYFVSLYLMSTTFISSILRHFTPRRSRSAMRFAGRLVTSIRTVFFPFLSTEVSKLRIYGTLHAQPIYTLFIYTRALSRTSPRSMAYVPIACGVMLNVVSYTPVPIVTLAESSSSVSHVWSLLMLNDLPTFGASSVNDSFQPLSRTISVPGVIFVGRITRGSLLLPKQSSCRNIDSPERSVTRTCLSGSSTA